MKNIFLLTFTLLFSTILWGQKVAPQQPNKVAPTDTIVPGKGSPESQIEKIKEVKIKQLSDSVGGNEPKKSVLVDTTVQNKYGDLLNDDTLYNKKYPWWNPAFGVIGINVFEFSVDRNL